ncbi:MAG: GNAT family N-acetyltransferase [Methylophilaceae bacterium]
MSLILEIVDSMQAVSQPAWDALAGDMPLLSHAFLSALEDSKSVGSGTGWQPYPMLVHANSQLVGAMPLYIKSHSYGEYVFDWAWADAYTRSGLDYYPKLLSALPFSPITSARLLAGDAQTKNLMLEALTETMHKFKLSSAHVLFPNDESAAALEKAGWLKRKGVQFRWENKNYADFEDFLATLSHDKRKRIHQERKKVVQAGVVCRHIKGEDITETDWDFFYHCYCNTYTEHRSTPYLTRAFFSQISRTMPQNIVLMVAEMAGEPIASALNLYNQSTLYGRYWGATQFVSGLHFELCYYQAQQFCIVENIRYFEGGAQGEHKLARGFEPRPTCSYHQIAQPEFSAAISQFLTLEQAGITAYTNELEERVPYKAD